MILSLLDTFKPLYKKGLWFLFGTETFIPRDRFAPIPRLHMAIHGFVLIKYTKPDDEHHLQAYPTLRKPRFLYHDRYYPLNLTKH